MSQVITCPKIGMGTVTQRYYAFVQISGELFIYYSTDGGTTWDWYKPDSQPALMSAPSVITYFSAASGTVTN